MEVYRISAITLVVRSMAKSCNFYSRIPGFKLVYGGPAEPFSTFEVGNKNAGMHLNLELTSSGLDEKNLKQARDFGRIIFHAKDVDQLYFHLKSDAYFSKLASFESEPADASWGERFFHIRDPDGYQLSFAKPIVKAGS
ncbi:MAG: VOC family protein [Thermoproteota archaeon]